MELILRRFEKSIPYLESAWGLQAIYLYYGGNSGSWKRRCTAGQKYYCDLGEKYLSETRLINSGQDFTIHGLLI
ncbi:MAG: hypothetical protein R2744_09020 [Bacteroidales bacterium]